MEKITIFCGVCGKYMASVPAMFEGRYRAAVCKECRRNFNQTTMEIDMIHVREKLREMRAGGAR